MIRFNKHSALLILALISFTKIYNQRLDSLSLQDSILVDYLNDFHKTNIPEHYFYFTAETLDRDFIDVYNEVRLIVPSLPPEPKQKNISSDDFVSWCFGMQFYVSTIGKWEEVETTAQQLHKDRFHRDIDSAYIFEIYLPELTLHFIDLDEDGEIDLNIYDCTEGNSSITLIFSYSDTLVLHDEFPDYVSKVRKIKNGIKILTSHSFGPTTTEFNIETYTISKVNGKIEIKPELHIATWHSIKIPEKVSFIPFVTLDTTYVGEGFMDEIYPAGSQGLILGKSKKYYLVCMQNNIPPVNSWRNETSRLWSEENFRPYYTIGYIDKKNFKHSLIER